MEILSRLHHYDQRLFLWFVHICQFPNLKRCAKVVSRTGDGYSQVILPMLVWVWFGSHAMAFIKSLAAAFAAERVLYWLLKNRLKRKRPPAAIPSFVASITASDEFSFPSGHTSAAFLLAFMTAFHFEAAATPLLIWASSVGLSRVILGVHFPADVAAGFCLGAGLAWYFHFVVFI